MQQLNHLQTWFQKFVVSSAADRRQLDNTDHSDAKCEVWIRPSKTLRAKERLEIYANMFDYRLPEVLRQVFPALLNILGAKRFDNLASRFYSAVPPTDPCLQLITDQFCEYILDQKKLHNKKLIQQIVQYEAAVDSVYFGADQVAVTDDLFKEIASKDLSTTKLFFHPNIRLITGEFPLKEMHLQAELAKEILSTSESKKRHYLIWRPNWQVQACEIFPEEFLLISALSSGRTLVEAVPDLVKLRQRLFAETEPNWQQIATAVQSSFSSWSSKRLICGYQQMELQ